MVHSRRCSLRSDADLDMSLQWFRRHREAGEDAADDVIGADVVRECLEGEHDAMPDDIERKVHDVLTHHVAPSAQEGERSSREHEVDRGTRARAVRHVLGDVIDAVLRGLARRRGEPHDVLHQRRVHEDLVDFALKRDEPLRSHHRYYGREPPSHSFDHDELVHFARIADQYLHHETVDLGFGQLVDTLRLDRVLSRHHEERIRHFVRLAADGHLPLLHDLKQRALDLRWCPVDLVGEEEVREDRAKRRLEITGPLVVDARSDEVRGDKIGRELDALELAGNRLRDGLDRECLRKPGHALDEKMAARQEADQETLEQMILPDDDLLDLEQQPPGVRWYRDLRFGHDVPSPQSGGRPSAPAALSIVTANPTPLNDGCPVGFTSPVTIPTTSPSRFTSGPPEDPGFTAASNWMSPASVRPDPGTCTLRFRPLITPTESERVSAKGFPTTIASSPMWSVEGLPRVAGAICAGGVAGRSAAMSFSTICAMITARDCVPSAKTTVTLGQPWTTCSAVRMSPASSITTPDPASTSVPSGFAVLIWTTAGATFA